MANAENDSPPGQSAPPRPEPAPAATAVGNFFHQAERLVYILVAALLLLAALGTCAYAVFTAVKEARQPGNLAAALFTLLSDLLLVLIILELLRTVGRFIRKEEPGVSVADLTPFLIVGAISATRRLLAIGANLSIAESHRATQDSDGPASPAFEPEQFRQAMIELGVNGALILAITVSLLLISRYLPQAKEQLVHGEE